MLILDKLSRLRKRHGENFFSGLYRESLAKLMRFKCGRLVIGRVFGFCKRNPDRIVFMTGCYNSGTTIIKDVLCLHPELSSPPVEGAVITSDLVDFDLGLFPRGMYFNISALARESNAGFNKKRYMREISPWYKANTMFLDKSISNTVQLKKLIKTFPNAFVVNVIRDPESTISGIKKKSKPARSLQNIFGDGYNDSLLLQQWKAMYESVLDAEVSANQFVNIEFNEFLKSPDEVIKKAWSDLGLSHCDIACVNGSVSANGKNIEVKGRVLDISDPVYMDCVSKLNIKAVS